MVARRTAISIRLDEVAQHQIDRAARLLNQSPAAFLRDAGAETARQVLLAWAVGRYREGAHTFSELADETGLDVETIMRATASADRDEALDFYLAAARTAAQLLHDDEFLRSAQAAVADVRRTDSRELP
jgi:uncharacterized protein (DUF1778 family)